MLEVEIPAATPADSATAVNPDYRTAKEDWNRQALGKEPKPKAADSAPATEEVKEEPKPAESDSAPEPTDATGSEPEPQQQERRQKTKADTERRFNELTDQLKEARREIEELRKAPQSAKQASQPAAEKKEDKRPEPTDLDDKGLPKYKDWAEYEKSRDEWLIAKARRDSEETWSKAQKEREAKQAEEAINKKFYERITESRKKHDDYDLVALSKDLPITKGSPVDMYLVDSEEGAEVLYYLGQNPEELKRINALNPLRQVRELTQIELNLTKPAPPAKPISKAPKPPSEVGGRGTAPSDEGMAAVQANDYRSAKAVWNRQALAHK